MAKKRLVKIKNKRKDAMAERGVQISNSYTQSHFITYISRNLV
ncbi:hypothetical protein [Campylobacter hyointestinalis]|nr:hypothetical protein [Campylobacter hyointestinalis]